MDFVLLVLILLILILLIAGLVWLSRTASSTTAAAAVVDPYRAVLVPGSGVRSGGSGSFLLVETANPNVWTYTLNYQGLTGPATVAHIHYASNKKIAYPVNLNAGTVTISNNDLILLKNGGLYVNVHTAKYPDGEISGTLRYTTNY